MENQVTEQKKKVPFRIVFFWILAFIITAFSAYYQRVTGPTYPLSGAVSFQGKDIAYKFERSSDTSKNCPVKISVPDESVKGYILWKRYKTNDDKTRIDMRREDGMLVGELPKQPPAGKLQYSVVVVKDDQVKEIPAEPVIVRYKGDVPSVILIIHVVFIFAAMLVSTRAGIEFFNKEPNFKKFALWSLGLMTLGGMVLGPIVQKYAFGEYWTGIPFGFDLTDNKTLFAWITWIIAAVAVFRSKKPGMWILLAALVTLIIFIIPHSVLGSELDYSKIK